MYSWSAVGYSKTWGLWHLDFPSLELTLRLWEVCLGGLWIAIAGADKPHDGNQWHRFYCDVLDHLGFGRWQPGKRLVYPATLHLFDPFSALILSDLSSFASEHRMFGPIPTEFQQVWFCAKVWRTLKSLLLSSRGCTRRYRLRIQQFGLWKGHKKILNFLNMQDLFFTWTSRSFQMACWATTTAWRLRMHLGQKTRESQPAIEALEVPFPLPFAQLLGLLLVAFSCFIPVYVINFTGSPVAGPILSLGTKAMARYGLTPYTSRSLRCFFLFESLWCLNEVAKEKRHEKNKPTQS